MCLSPFVSTEGVTPFRCAKTVSEPHLFQLPGLPFERKQIPQIVVIVRIQRKTMEPLEPTTAPLGAGGRAFKSPRPDQFLADSKRVVRSALYRLRRSFAVCTSRVFQVFASRLLIAEVMILLNEAVEQALVGCSDVLLTY